jgi:hypothetical protein
VNDPTWWDRWHEAGENTAPQPLPARTFGTRPPTWVFVLLAIGIVAFVVDVFVNPIHVATLYQPAN